MHGAFRLSDYTSAWRKSMDWLRSEAQRLEIRDADLTTAKRRPLDHLRIDIEECEEYHERL